MLAEVEAYYERRRELQSLSTAIIISLCFDKSATLLASGTTTGVLTVHSLTQAADLSPLNTRDESLVSRFDLSQHGSINALCNWCGYLVIGTDAGILTLFWDSIDDSTQVPRILIEKENINSISSSTDGRQFTAATADGVLIQFRESGEYAERPRVQKAANALKAFPQSVAVSPADEHYVVSGCHDGLIRLYDWRRTDYLVCTLNSSVPKKPHFISSVTFNPDGNYVLAASSGRTLSSYHLASRNLIESVELPFLPQAMSFSDTTLYVGGSDRRAGHASSLPNSLLAFNTLCTSLQHTSVSAGAVYSIAAHPTRHTLAAAGFTPHSSVVKTQRHIDVYSEPPIRSFSVLI